MPRMCGLPLATQAFILDRESYINSVRVHHRRNNGGPVDEDLARVDCRVLPPFPRVLSYAMSPAVALDDSRAFPSPFVALPCTEAEENHKSMVRSSITETVVLLLVSAGQIFFVRRWFQGKGTLLKQWS